MQIGINRLNDAGPLGAGVGGAVKAKSCAPSTVIAAVVSTWVRCHMSRWRFAEAAAAATVSAEPGPGPFDQSPESAAYITP